MIRGTANARHEAVVRLRLRSPDGAEQAVDAVVDSGFTAALTLPTAIATSLGLPLESAGQTRLADGTVRQFDIRAAEVSWFGAWRTVLVSVLGEEVLLGMRLLADHAVRIEVVPGGAVELTPLPTVPSN